MSVRTILKSRWTGTLAMALVALSVAMLATLLLPGRADAQEEQAAANTTTRTVGPGDSLWTIAQAQLASDAAAPQQVAEEVERIYALNREWIGDDPNLLLVGQELLLVGPALSEEASANEEPATTSGEAEPVAESVTDPVTESMIEPVAQPAEMAASNTAASTQQPAEEGPATAITEANEEPATGAATTSGEEEPAAQPAEEPVAEEEDLSSSEPEGVVGEGIAVDRKILGVGILLLTALIAILIVVWRLLIYRRPSSDSFLYHSEGYRRHGENYSGYYDNYAQPHQPEQPKEKEEQQTAETEAAERGALELEAEPAPQAPAASAASTRDIARRRRRQRAVLTGRQQRRPRRGR